MTLFLCLANLNHSGLKMEKNNEKLLIVHTKVQVVLSGQTIIHMYDIHMLHGISYNNV